jgi:hypothetical protein
MPVEYMENHGISVHEDAPLIYSFPSSTYIDTSGVNENGKKKSKEPKQGLSYGYHPASVYPWKHRKYGKDLAGSRRATPFCNVGVIESRSKKYRGTTETTGRPRGESINCKIEVGIREGVNVPFPSDTWPRRLASVDRWLAWK